MGYRRKLAHRDANHEEIVAALLSCGCTVLDLSAVGDGCPDLAVGRARTTFLLEIKSPKAARYTRKKDARQREWRAAWRGGPVAIVTCAEEALWAVGAM